MKSIRRTLQLRLAVAAFVLLLVGAGVLYAGVRWLLTDQFDDVLRSKLATFSSLVEQEGDYLELGFIEQTMPEFRAGTRPEYVQMWLADRADDWVVYRSPSLAEGNLPRIGGTVGNPSMANLSLPDGRAGRAIGGEFVVHQTDPDPNSRPPARIAIVLARETASLDRALAWLLAGMVIVSLLVIGGGFVLGNHAVRRGLSPLDELARGVAAIEDPTLAPGFDAGRAPEELVPLVESHNEMLSRLRAAFERERRTAAGIAHELRTPVAELLLLAETAQRFPANVEENARRLRELREICEQMSRMIATLLELGRMESGRAPLEVESLDLAEAVRESWSALAAAASAKRQTFEAPAGRGPVVRADRVALSILLGNVLRNAVDHAPEGERIGCELEANGRACSLVVSNSANGVKPDDVDKLTEPFWRASPSREDRSHAGIGLALARRLAELLEVDLSFRIESGVFRARLSFPTG